MKVGGSDHWIVRFAGEDSKAAKPARLKSAAGGLSEALDEAAIMLKLVGDNQLAVLEVGNRRVVRRTMMQSVRDLFLKGLISTFQVGMVVCAMMISDIVASSIPREREMAKLSLT